MLLKTVTGGVAGSVLANRLSEVSSVKVLLIEAGGRYVSSFCSFTQTSYRHLPLVYSPDGIQAVEVPFLGTSLPGSSIDWNYTITPQIGLNGRSFELTRGKVLGGSSCLSKPLFQSMRQLDNSKLTIFVTQT